VGRPDRGVTRDEQPDSHDGLTGVHTSGGSAVSELRMSAIAAAAAAAMRMMGVNRLTGTSL
jgi:hypothetical protein